MYDWWLLAIRVFSLTVLILVSLSPISTTSLMGPQDRATVSGVSGIAQNVPVSGAQSTLVVLVQFPDKSNTTSPPKIAGMMTGLNSYYAEDSYGMVSFTSILSPAVATWYVLPQNVAYYSSGSPSADNQLITDSLEAAYKSGVDFHDYKFAMVVHAGADEAMTHSSSDIHSFTIPGYVFSPAPLTSYQISTSVVSESDPVGVYCHEAGHLLGLPDLYDLTQQIDPANNFVGYWEIMALGEWNPNNANPLQPSPGTFPSQHSSWSKIKLGWISNSSLRTVYPGNLTTITVENLEQPTNRVQAVKIPISVNNDGSLSYYLVEMRAKLGTYDQYLPFPSDYPGAALLIYKVNESIANGHGSLRLIDAHPGGDLSDAGFGPCPSPCVSNNTFADPANFLKVIVTNTTATSYTIVVDRTSSPLLLLQVNTPSTGMLVSVDGANLTSDQSKELRLPVHFGPHEVFVQAQVPLSIGGSSVQVGLTDSFAAWDDGVTANPRWISISRDTVLTATYRVMVEPSFATAATAILVLGVVIAGIALNRRRHLQRPVSVPSQKQPSGQGIPASIGNSKGSFPGNDGSARNSVKHDDQPNSTQP